ncbi:hypothetical protein Ae717Ps2_6230c [Pseudonocardia sp. Ae717_Ps2]|nr:hypothetical protein Ae717Ps2_6230c [Pseudonocardia sp. Ae717_Ps2]
MVSGRWPRFGILDMTVVLLVLDGWVSAICQAPADVAASAGAAHRHMPGNRTHSLSSDTMDNKR